MVATQFFFTLCLCGLLIAALLILMYLFCINDYYKIHVLRATGIDLIVSGELLQLSGCCLRHLHTRSLPPPPFLQPLPA